MGFEPIEGGKDGETFVMFTDVSSMDSVVGSTMPGMRLSQCAHYIEHCQLALRLMTSGEDALTF